LDTITGQAIRSMVLRIGPFRIRFRNWLSFRFGAPVYRKQFLCSSQSDILPMEVKEVRWIAYVGLVSLLAAAALGATWWVPEGFLTIQAAIEAAFSGHKTVSLGLR